MKISFLGLATVLILGCSGGSSSPTSSSAETSKSPSTTERMSKRELGGPKVVEKFGDDVFGVPAYPGSEHRPYTGIEANSDGARSYGRHFTTPDDLDKVETFIKTEGEKLGAYSNPAKGVFNEKMMRNGIVEMTDGRKFVFKLTHDEKGGKTDIMYSITEPKKK